MNYYAHSGHDRTERRSDWELLATHLLDVASLAEHLAADTGLPGLAVATRAAGLLHDLSKYRPAFQHHIRQPRGHIGGPDSHHKQPGAARCWSARHPLLAFAIAGHHGGVPDAAGLKGLVAGPAGQPAFDQIWAEATADCPDLASHVPPVS